MRRQNWLIIIGYLWVVGNLYSAGVVYRPLPVGLLRVAAFYEPQARYGPVSALHQYISP